MGDTVSAIDDATPPRPAAPIAPRVKLLLVDDHPDQLLVLETLLAELGQELIRANSGREALRQCLQHDFALILMDVNMPGMDGFETASLIRSRPKSRQTPIIFVTAYDETETHVARGYSLGAVDYIHTPVLPEVLLAKASVFVDLALRTAEVKCQAEELEERVAERTRELQELNATLAAEIAQRESVAQDRIRLLAAAEEGVRRRDDFLAILAHELRNPLASIVSGAELLQLCDDGDPASEQAREVIARQAQHMTSLLRDLLDVSRITRGKIELHLEMVDVGRAIKEAVQNAASDLTRDGREVTVRLPETPIAIDADPTRLHQVLINLLGNAAKFTPPRGRIEIAADRDEGHARIQVRDSGIGIPEERLDDVFEPFVQLKANHSRPSSGLGIGLTMVRNLVELHRGRVAVNSRGENQGTEFTVHIPLAAPRVSAESPVKLFSAQSSDGPGPRALRFVVIEDNDDIRSTVVELIRKLGHDVWIASDGPSGIEIIERARPDVALVDIGLPGLDGYELARRISAIPALKATRLVAMTGYGQPEDRRRAIEAGFQSHLVKPVSLDDFRQLTREIASDHEKPASRAAVS
ncbi:Autoinducer 2 sensor kinase/phosphatase LuxQ [Caulifigura coniformis]|uniref:histidine kinase n=1 Tax=Caulifigura coniformis TaxID=2527983 RepID=A0A517SI70_9PLAN|nr:response regulator [Caulifigura coniformis]QDT55823.1 Autoinducer 2 sensor kinase/phosphatase LuxQ [Caulifigura coniformis]